jgi:hypothetical protein
MAARRRAPNKTERIAACLLMLKRGDEWLIPEPLRSTGTAEEICSVVEWHHSFRHASGGDTRPQNITPMRIADHKVKTFGSKATTAGSDVHGAAQSKRLQRSHEEFKARMLAKATGAEPPKRKAKAKIANRPFSKQSRPFPKRAKNVNLEFQAPTNDNRDCGTRGPEKHPF